VHRFGITERDWHRIKLNIDSKCRTAFRRKIRGQPLTVKAFRGKSSYIPVGQPVRTDSDDDTNSMQETDNSVLDVGEVCSSTDVYILYILLDTVLATDVNKYSVPTKMADELDPP